MQNRVAYYLYRYTLLLKSPDGNVGVVATVRREGKSQEVGARMTFLQGGGGAKFENTQCLSINILSTNYKLNNSKKTSHILNVVFKHLQSLAD